jgi:dTMP kinase
VITREPGGSPGADHIRALLVEGAADRWAPMEEALLFSAARASHVRNTVQPALARGDIVVCDRFFDSTIAYQAAAGGVARADLEALNRIIGAPQPDLTLILDLDPSLGLARARERAGGEDRFEKKGADFHARVRAAFLDIARAEPTRCVVLDASLPPDALAVMAWSAIERKARELGA